MKFYFILLFLSACVPDGYCWQQVQRDSLRVWAETGLNLREQASEKSTRITVIPFGSTILVLDTMENRPMFQRTLFKPAINPKSNSNQYYNYTLKGTWLKVQYAKQTGYVFDFYLSSFPVSRQMLNRMNQPNEQAETLKELTRYLSKYFQISKPKAKRSLNGSTVETFTFYTNIVLKHSFHGDDFDKIDLTLPGWKFNEAYLLAKIFFGIEEDFFWGCGELKGSLQFWNECEGMSISSDSLGSYIKFGIYD